MESEVCLPSFVPLQDWEEDDPDEERCIVQMDDRLVRTLSIEDDAGFIHEFHHPGRGVPADDIYRAIHNRYRTAAAPAPHRPDTLADMVVVAWLGFLTFIAFNIAFGPKDIQPPDFLWCVFSLSRDACVAPFA